MRALLDVILIILQLYVYVIIASAILSWLVAFNVVNRYNEVGSIDLEPRDRIDGTAASPDPERHTESWRYRYFACDFTIADFLHSTRNRGIYLYQRLLNLEHGPVEFSRATVS